MSLDFDTNLKPPIQLDPLEKLAHGFLVHLTNCTNSPIIKVDSKERTIPEGESDSFFAFFEGISSEKIQVTFIHVPSVPGFIDESESGMVGSASIFGAQDNSVGVVLGLSIIIALASQNDGIIFDEKNFLKEGRMVSYQTILQRFSNKTPFEDFQLSLKSISQSLFANPPD